MIIFFYTILLISNELKYIIDFYRDKININKINGYDVIYVIES